MDYVSIINKIHHKILDAEDELLELISGIDLIEHWYAKQLKDEWQTEIDKINQDKESFLQLAGEDIFEAIKQFNNYLFPFQLKIKHEIENL